MTRKWLPTAAVAAATALVLGSSGSWGSSGAEASPKQRQPAAEMMERYQAFTALHATELGSRIPQRVARLYAERTAAHTSALAGRVPRQAAARYDELSRAHAARLRDRMGHNLTSSRAA